MNVYRLECSKFDKSEKVGWVFMYVIDKDKHKSSLNTPSVKTARRPRAKTNFLSVTVMMSEEEQ